ncbi:MAG: hypothetical protein ACLP7Q_14240 [Isosphaeraceae bacterium]
MRPPSSKGSYETLPEEKQARNEAAVDLFGQHLLSLRNQLFDRVRQTVESDESRGLLPRLKRQEYEAVATLAPEVREVTLELASKSVDLYIQSLLLLLSDIGSSLAFGPYHALNYRLVMEVKESRSGTIVDEFTVNRDGRKTLANYHGRWLNRHADHR